MLLTVVGAVTVATVIVLAAHAARDRRVLVCEVRALRDDVRALAARLAQAPAGADAPPLTDDSSVAGSHVEHPDLPGQPEAAPGAAGALPTRNPKTLH